MPINQRGSSFQVAISTPQGRLRRSFKTRRDAEVWERDTLKAIREGTPLPEVRDTVDNQTFGEFLTQSKDFLWGNAKTTERLVRNAEICCQFFGMNTPIASIKGPDIITYIEHMMGQGNTNATINRKLSALQKLLKHAKLKGILSEVPPIPHMKESERRQRFLTEKEEAHLYKRFDHLGMPQFKFFMMFLLYTGARGGEALRVFPEDIDLNSEPGKVTFWITKGGQARTLPLASSAREAVEWALERREEGKPLFHMVKDYYAFYRAFRQVREWCGYGVDVIPYTLRHTCASRLVQRGVDIRRVQKWMGHADIQITLRYAHLAPSDLNEAASLL